MQYEDFIKSKKIKDKDTGIVNLRKGQLNELMFDYQKDILLWSLRRGRSCIWAGCGLGKTLLELEFCKHVNNYTNKPVLIIAPLAVSEQTANCEAKKFGYDCKIVANQQEIINGINITNYEKIEKFDFSTLGGIILDESSILKSVSGKIRGQILEKTSHIPFRLACSATPAPNDFMEIGNHAEFVGAMTYSRMLSTFFVHDGGDTAKWRLKGHAKDVFFQWVSSWAVMIRKPSDLGYSDDGFELPKITIKHVTVKTENKKGGFFQYTAETLNDRQAARRETVDIRCEAVKQIVDQLNPGEQCFIWCNLNMEADTICRMIAGSVNVQGSDTNEYKTDNLIKFSKGEIPIMISKPKIAGMGMNFQSCHNTIFLGLSDSFEQYYQAVRRFWRFGQKHPVNVYIVTADIEGNVVKNIKRKEIDADKMYAEMQKYMSEINKRNIRGIERDNIEYNPAITMALPKFLNSK